MGLNKIFKYGFLILVAVFFTACGVKGAKFAGFTEPKEGNSAIYVYRPASFVGSGVSYKVAIDDGEHNQTIGRISNGAYARAEVPADKEVEIWAKTEAKSSVTIETKNKETYCIKAGVGMGFFVGRPHLKQVDFVTCEKEIVTTQLHK